MALVVNTNVAALNAQRNLGITNNKMGKSLERLASGLRINRSADDAAGLAIATKLSAQVRGLNQAARNSNNAISLLQTAEGGINTVTNILQRLRELAVQSSSDDNTTADRANLTSESDALVAEVTRIVNTSEYNSSRLLDGSFSGQFFQIGANYGQNVTFSISDTRGSTIGNIAKQDFDIADGVTTALDANFTTGEFTVNSANVGATNSTDDQYSVLDLSSEQMDSIGLSTLANTIGAIGSASAGTAGELDVNLQINGVALSLNFAASVGTNSAVQSLSALEGTLVTGASLATDIVAAINNNASLTALNITARVVNTSGYVIERTEGGDINAVVSLNGSFAATGGASYLSIADSASFTLVGLQDLVSGTSVIGNGYDMTAATGPTAYNGQSSAIAKAAAISSIKNASGVDATAQANTVAISSAVGGGTISSGDIYINGYDLGALGTILASDTDASLATGINAISTNTGVTAAVDSGTGKLTLSASDGRNITITVKESADATILGLGAAHSGTSYIYRSEVRLTDNSAISLAGTLGDLYGDAAGATSKTTAVANTVALDTSQNVAAIDISTRDSAQDAILIIDSALDRVNTIRSEIGAVQNRMEFTIANLDIASENMSAAESRIRDADFAIETAAFTRNQIMVQAATAILAQANTMPQMALQLLS
jgi:flagellin